MTVAWIDTSASGARAGRGIVMSGRWASAEETRDRVELHKKKPRKELSVRVPVDLPNGLINPFTIGLMNTFWYYKHGAAARTEPTSSRPSSITGRSTAFASGTACSARAASSSTSA